MKSYRPGEVILLSFPFANAIGAKQRPAAPNDWMEVLARVQQLWASN